MPKIRNVSPIGALDVPLIGRHLDAGEEADVTAEQAAVLLAQADNYAPADKAANDIVKALAAAVDAPVEPPVTPPVVVEAAPDPTPAPDAAGAPDATTEGAA